MSAEGSGAETGPLVEQAFGTPVIHHFIEDHLTVRQALEPLILERRRQDEGLCQSNVGGWHSDVGLLGWGGDAARELGRRAAKLASANTAHCSAPGKKREWRVEAWANVHTAGAYHTPHIHPGCYWAAVYYLRCDPGDGGDLVLHDPRLPRTILHDADLRFAGSGAEPELKISPRSGQLLLFPAWLFHSVTPWLGEGLRISIALNISTRPS